MRNKKILFVSQEITPYLQPSYMGDLCRLMPQKIQEEGYEVRTFMPKYGCINERRNQLHEVIRLSGKNLVIDDADHPLIIKVATLQPSRMQVYFIDNDEYFQHTPQKELEITADPGENDERMMFFVQGVIEAIRKLRWEPAIIHCSGWFSSLMPLYLKRLYAEDPTVGQAKVVVSLFADSFEGTLDVRFIEKLKMDGFTDEDLLPLQGEVDCTALLKLAVRYADGVVQNSQDASAEVVEYAHELSKPLLPFAGEDIDAGLLADFYQQL